MSVECMLAMTPLPCIAPAPPPARCCPPGYAPLRARRSTRMHSLKDASSIIRRNMASFDSII